MWCRRWGAWETLVISTDLVVMQLPHVVPLPRAVRTSSYLSPKPTVLEAKQEYQISVGFLVL